MTRFSKVTVEGDADPLVSLVIFEFRDEDLIGRYIGGDKTKVWAMTLSQSRFIHMLTDDGNLGERNHLRPRKR